jgi:DNA-binding NtrC family response regulator
MSRQLPPQSNLRQLRNQAKDLSKAYQAREIDALKRFRKSHPQHQESSDARLAEAGLTLQDAQLVIAREYGFDSWPKLAASLADLPERPLVSGDVIGDSQALQLIRATLERAALTDVPVFIAGEKGVGKRLMARTIHAASRRGSTPLVQMTCNVGNGLLCDSFLFGYEPGAFTGARSSHAGNLELATGGTLVLEEIGGLTSAAQAKLQQFIEGGIYRRLGGTQDLTADVRLISTTTQDLETMVKSGSFREDLYYQRTVLRLELPPLRDRTTDIPALANYFAQRSSNGHDGTPQFGQEALTLLLSHTWPGNVRELRTTVERAVAETSGATIPPDAIHLQFPTNPPNE